MAEALLDRIDAEHFEASSAGRSHGRPHPLTLEVMSELGVELSQAPHRTVPELADERFDFVITLDEGTASLSRNFRDAEIIHWKFDDPLALVDAQKQLRAFRMVRDQIAQRLRLFVIVEVRSRAPSVSAYSPESAKRRITA
jgi:protein-tyrosine-phosphatase